MTSHRPLRPSAAVLAATLAAAALIGVGCSTERKRRPDPDNATPAPAPVAPPVARKQLPAPNLPTPTAAVAAASLPPECTEYQAEIDRLATCDGLPAEAKGKLRDMFDQARATWPALATQGGDNLARSCAYGAQVLLSAVAAPCQW